MIIAKLSKLSLVFAILRMANAVPYAGYGPNEDYGHTGNIFPDPNPNLVHSFVRRRNNNANFHNFGSNLLTRNFPRDDSFVLVRNVNGEDFGRRREAKSVRDFGGFVLFGNFLTL